MATPRNSTDFGGHNLGLLMGGGGGLPLGAMAVGVTSGGGHTSVYAGDWKMEKLEGSMPPLSLFLTVPDFLEARLPYLPPIRYARVRSRSSRGYQGLLGGTRGSS